MENLAKIAEAGDLGEDAWMDHLDSQLTYSENKANLMEIAGLEEAQTPFKTDKEKAIQKYEHLQAKRREEAETQGKIEKEGRPKTPDLENDNIEQEPLANDEQSEARRVVTSDSDDFGWEQDIESVGQDEGEELIPSFGSIKGASGDEYDYTSVRMPVETADLLERMKLMLGLGSRRAVIEKLASEHPEFFENDDGQLPPEWYDALERSKEFDNPNRNNR